MFKRSLKNCIWNITAWPILSFQGSNFRLKQIHFLVFKSLFKKLYQGRCSKDFIEISTWGHILFALKRLLKNVSRMLQFDPYYCFKDLIQIFNYSSYIFWCEIFFKKLCQGQYGLTNFVLFKDPIKFSLTAHFVLFLRPLRSCILQCWSKSNKVWPLRYCLWEM